MHSPKHEALRLRSGYKHRFGDGEGLIEEMSHPGQVLEGLVLEPPVDEANGCLDFGLCQNPFGIEVKRQSGSL
jgi:hypothetical protein